MRVPFFWTLCIILAETLTQIHKVRSAYFSLTVNALLLYLWAKITRTVYFFVPFTVQMTKQKQYEITQAKFFKLI